MKRQAIENAIEALLALLDAMDGDPDLENDGADEPSLGWTIHGGTGLDNRDLEIFEVAA